MIETLASLALAGGQDFRSIVKADPISNVSSPQQWLVAGMGGGPTASGIRVGPDNARQIVAVYCSVNLISRILASLPVFVFRSDKNDGRSVANRHPLYPVLHDEPNPWMTSFEFRQMMQGHLLLRGNAYAFILRDNFARVVSLIPLHPDSVTPLKAPDGQPFYRVHDKDRNISGVFSRREIFHLRGESSDGYVGLSPISVVRESLGLAMVLQDQGARLFSNGTVTSGVLEFPEALNDEILDRIRAQWSERYTGSMNAHKPLILEKGMKWQSLGMTSEDAQFLQTRAFQDQQIYRIFGVPPHMVGDNEKTTSWGTGVEQLSIGFVIYTLMPWLECWEQAISQMLLLPQERASGLYAEFEVDGLLRGDQKSRNDALATKRQNGIINANEWRRLENLDPIPGPAGEAYLVNGSMISTDAAVAGKTAQNPPQNP